jgi:hypothetical protein
MCGLLLLLLLLDCGSCRQLLQQWRQRWHPALLLLLPVRLALLLLPLLLLLLLQLSRVRRQLL